MEYYAKVVLLVRSPEVVPLPALLVQPEHSPECLMELQILFALYAQLDHLQTTRVQ
jgi:hypothetical protein